MSHLPESNDTQSANAGCLEVHLLGTVEYVAYLGLQEYLTYDLSGRNDQNGKLLLCEHPPLVTVGREAVSSDVQTEEGRPHDVEVEVRWMARGGGAYAHAPGQLAIYLMIPLHRLRISPSDYRTRLEQAVCASCQELKVPAKRIADSPGIWGRGGQLGFFGASLRSGITNHGIFLNVSISPDFLAMTIPNHDDLPATSIQAHRLQPIQMPKLRESLIRTISKNFDYDQTDVSTGHPLLKRQRKQVIGHV